MCVFITVSCFELLHISSTLSGAQTVNLALQKSVFPRDL